MVVSGNCVDKRDLGLRDLQVEILSAPSSAIVGNAYNITVKVSNVGSNATPDPFFVILSNATATLGYKVMTLPANSNVTFNFTWIPTTAGTERLNVTVDGLLVPALATYLRFGSVVELNGFPASEVNNTASVTVIVSTPTTPLPTTTPTPTTTTPRPIGGGAGGGAIPGIPIYISPYIAVMAKERYEITMPSATQKDTNVLSIVVIPEKNVNVRVRVEKLEKLPPGIPLPEGIVALILSVELTLSKETGVKGEINFVLKRDEIRNLGFDRMQFSLLCLDSMKSKCGGLNSIQG